jgi:hypothetical protein
MTLAEGYHRALTRAGVPVISVSIGSPDNRATWRVTFGPGVTPEQVTIAAQLQLSYDFANDVEAQNEDAAGAFDTMKMLKAVALTMVDAINIERAQHGRAAITPAVAKAQVLDKYRSL